MSKPIFYLLLVVFCFVSCSTLGTKTLYKSDIKNPIKKIGFTKLDGDTIVSKLFPQTDSIFKKAFLETCKNYNLNEVFPLNKELSIGQPDTTSMAQICNEKNLDGLIVSRLKFIHVTYNMNFIPIAKNWDTEVEMKLFDKKGGLLLSVKHNTTKGNSYFMPPTADRTIYDGTEGAIKRIAKEMSLTK